MKVLVKCMYSDGELLNAKALEKAPRWAGNLVVEQWLSAHACRSRKARLQGDTGQLPHEIIPPLVEPVLVELKDNRMVLVGHQVHVDAESGAVHELRQGWIIHLTVLKVLDSA